VGTSYNSLGKSKDSEISELNNTEAENIYNTEANKYIIRKIREYKDERLLYKMFVL
jgi:hypothetical protein